MSDGDNTSAGGGRGCIGTIVALIVLWAFFFGFTVDGKHYEVFLSCDDGVRVVAP